MLRGKVEIKNFYAEKALLNWKTNYTKELFGDSNANSSESIEVLISSLSLNDFNFFVFDSTNKAILNLAGKSLDVKFRSNSNNLFLSVDGDLKKVALGNYFKITLPFLLKFDLEKSNKILYIYNIKSSIKSLNLSGSGIHDLNSESTAFRFVANRFLVQDLSFIPYLSISKQLIGSANAEAYLKITSGFEKIDTLAIKYKSDKLKWILKNEKAIIYELDGYTVLTENFTKHFSFIKKANIEKSNAKLNISARIKGFDNLVILSKGYISYDWGLKKPPVDIEAKGFFKALFSYSTITDEINPIAVKSELLFTNKQKAFSNYFLTKGKITISKDLFIEGYLKTDSSDINFKIQQPNILESLNKKFYFPAIELSGNHVNYNDIVRFFASDTNDSTSNYLNIKKVSFRFDFNSATFNRLSLNKLKANGVIKGDTINVEYFASDCFDGNVSGKFKAFNNYVHTNLWISNVSIEKIFKNFDNWNQNFVTSDNLSGTIKGIVNIQFERNSKGDVDMNSLKLNSDIQIVKGKLKGMDKIKELSRWLNLDQVQVIAFDTLKNTITIENRKIIIPNMDVKSNVILMNLSGFHTFDNNYEYMVRVNFSNLLKKRFVKSDNVDFHSSTEGSLNLYLKLYGKSDDYRIDLINKKSFDAQTYNTTQTDSVTPKNTIQSKIDQKLENKAEQKFKLEWDEIDSLKTE
ncbi:MAG: AsmA-like C-terminal region-containing protein [Bacteroidota bacterium]